MLKISAHVISTTLILSLLFPSLALASLGGGETGAGGFDSGIGEGPDGSASGGSSGGGYSGAGGQDSPSEGGTSGPGGGANSGGGFGPSGAGGYEGGYSGYGGQDSPSEGNTSGPGGGANSGGGFGPSTDYSGRGGQNSPSEGNTSGPGGGANSGKGFGPTFSNVDDRPSTVSIAKTMDDFLANVAQNASKVLSTLNPVTVAQAQPKTTAVTGVIGIKSVTLDPKNPVDVAKYAAYQNAISKTNYAKANADLTKALAENDESKIDQAWSAFDQAVNEAKSIAQGYFGVAAQPESVGFGGTSGQGGTGQQSGSATGSGGGNAGGYAGQGNSQDSPAEAGPGPGSGGKSGGYAGAGGGSGTPAEAGPGPGSGGGKSGGYAGTGGGSGTPAESGPGPGSGGGKNTGSGSTNGNSNVGTAPAPGPTNTFSSADLGKYQTIGVINVQEMTPAQATVGGLNEGKYTENDIKTLAKAIAGETDNNNPNSRGIQSRIANGTMTARDAATVGLIAGTAINRASSNAGYRAGGPYGSLADALTADKQYSAFNDDKIGTTNANYNRNPKAFDELAKNILNGNFGDQWGLDTAVPAPTADSYANPDIVNVSFFAGGRDATGNIGGHVAIDRPGEYSRSGLAPGVEENLVDTAKSIFSVDSLGVVSGTGKTDNPFGIGDGTSDGQADEDGTEATPAGLAPATNPVDGKMSLCDCTRVAIDSAQDRPDPVNQTYIDTLNKALTALQTKYPGLTVTIISGTHTDPHFDPAKEDGKPSGRHAHGNGGDTQFSINGVTVTSISILADIAQTLAQVNPQVGIGYHNLSKTITHVDFEPTTKAAVWGYRGGVPDTIADAVQEGRSGKGADGVADASQLSDTGPVPSGNTQKSVSLPDEGPTPTGRPNVGNNPGNPDAPGYFGGEDEGDAVGSPGAENDGDTGGDGTDSTTGSPTGVGETGGSGGTDEGEVAGDDGSGTVSPGSSPQQSPSAPSQPSKTATRQIGDAISTALRAITDFFGDLLRFNKSEPGDYANLPKTATSTPYVPIRVSMDVETGQVTFERGNIQNYAPGQETFDGEEENFEVYKYQNDSLVFDASGQIIYSDGTYAPEYENGLPVQSKSGDPLKYIYLLERTRNGELITAEVNSASIPGNVLTQAIIRIFSDDSPFTLADVARVTYIYVDPDTNEDYNEYYDYNIYLHDGSKRRVFLPVTTSFAYYTEQLAKVGYSGNVIDLTNLGVEIGRSETTRGPGFLERILDNLAKTTKRVMSVFDSSGNSPTYTDLDLVGTKPQFSDSDLVSITVYLNVPLSCPAGYDHGYIYEAVVKMSGSARDGAIYGTMCGYGSPGSYAMAITTDLRDQGYIPTLKASTVYKNLYFKFYDSETSDLRNADAALGVGEISVTEPGAMPNQSNEISFEARVTNADGSVVRDWREMDVFISSDQRLDLRWDASKYKRCLPFLNDSGVYSLFYAPNIAMTTGNTVNDGFVLSKRNADYRIECDGQDNGESGVDVKIIKVQLSD